MRRSLPVLAGLGAALAFLPRARAGAWGVLALVFAVLAAPAFTDAVPPDRVRWVRAGWALAAVVVSLMAQGALYRIGVSNSALEARRRGLGLGGLQFSAPELRLFVAGGLVAGFLALVAGALVLVFAFVLTAEDAGLPSVSEVLSATRKGEGWAIVLGVLTALSAWALITLLVRLSLFKATTVARDSVVSVDAMSLAQGAFWSLLFGLLVVLIPVALIAGWERGLIGQGFVMPVSSKAYSLIRAGFLTLVEMPFGVGFLSYAYNRLEYRPRG